MQIVNFLSLYWMHSIFHSLTLTSRTTALYNSCLKEAYPAYYFFHRANHSLVFRNRGSTSALCLGAIIYRKITIGSTKMRKKKHIIKRLQERVLIYSIRSETRRQNIILWIWEHVHWTVQIFCWSVHNYQWQWRHCECWFWYFK